MLSLLLSASLAATAAPPALPSPIGDETVPIWSRAFGLSSVDGEPVGGGPHYSARFRSGGFEVTPAGGAPFTFTLEAIRRGETGIAEGSPGAPREVEGNVVRYLRGEGIVESIEVTRDGVEHSVRFDAPLPGSGDLVVVGKIESELRSPVRGEVTEGIRFEKVGLPSLHVGGVTGIDAEGKRAAGWLRFDGTRLEYGLPAAFVDGATFPIVLDPLIGPVITSLDPMGYVRNPDVAFDASLGIYLVVWDWVGILRGQRVLADGSLAGPLIVFPLGGEEKEPSVAGVEGSDRFVVAYRKGVSSLGPFSIEVRTVEGTNGAISPPLALPGCASNRLHADAGGDSLAALPNRAIVVWECAGAGIEGVVLDVPLAPNPPTVFGPLDLSAFASATSPDAHQPSVSKHAGTAGNWLVVWERDFPPPMQREIALAAVNLAGGFLAGGLLGVPGADDEDADCDTSNGTHFVVAWESETTAGSFANDIACATVQLSAGNLLPSSIQFVANDAGQDEVDPAVALAGTQAIVAWSNQASGLDYDLAAVVLQAGGCAPCSPEILVDGSPEHARRPQIASQWSGGGTNDEALLVWQSSSLDPPFEADVLAQRIEALGPGGPVTPLGAGCGLGGTIGVNGPVAVGNASFAITLTGAGGPPLFLVLGAAVGPLPCGPCTLRPDLGTSLLLAFPAPLGLPIPCSPALIGGSVHAQWVVLAPSGCPAFPFASQSDAITITIGT